MSIPDAAVGAKGRKDTPGTGRTARCQRPAVRDPRRAVLRGAAARLNGILTDLEIAHDVQEYADAGHSFMNDHRDEKTPWLFALMGRLTGGIDYVEPAALDARGRIDAFFARHLRDGG